MADSFESPDSSSVESASYNPLTEHLTVVLRPGKVYVYTGVTQDMWTAFEGAASKGQYFSAFIRPHFKGIRRV